MPAAPDQINQLRHLVTSARSLLPFTGAGISTESGVPDFRTPGSPWMVNKPIPFDVFLSSPAARREAWTRKFAMDDHFAGAEPNLGHRLIAEWVAEGRAPGVITQNIDGLHQAAGVSADHVVELHGNGTFATCLDCGRRHALAPLRRRFEQEGALPLCEGCGGIVKSATISFGQPMPQEAMRRAQGLIAASDLMLVLGSSLVVFPAAALPAAAVRAGVRLVIVNREPTELDAMATLTIRADIGETLQAAFSPRT